RFRRPLTPHEIELWRRELQDADQAWAIEVEGCCIGAACLVLHGTPERGAEYSISIMDPRQWGRGYGTEATRLVLAQAWSALRLPWVGLKVLATNRRAVACYTTCG